MVDGSGFDWEVGSGYMVAIEVDKELIWMKNFLNELEMKQERFLLRCDNQSAIHLAKDVVYHYRTKQYRGGITVSGRKWMMGCEDPY